MMFRKYVIRESNLYETSQGITIGAREEQQDAGLLICDEKQVFAAVCDGMGGLQQGARASATAVDTLCKLYAERKDNTNPIEFFQQAVDIVDEAVYELWSKKENGLTGTTCLAVWICDKYLSWLSVGDSRLYLARKNEIVCATVDQNYENYLLRGGTLPQDGGATPPRKDALISFMGRGGISWLDINSTPLALEPGDLILLMTDGLYRSVSETQMLSVLRSHANLDAAIEELLRLAEGQGGAVQDNTTVVVVKYRGNENETDKM